VVGTSPVAPIWSCAVHRGGRRHRRVHARLGAPGAVVTPSIPRRCTAPSSGWPRWTGASRWSVNGPGLRDAHGGRRLVGV